MSESIFDAIKEIPPNELEAAGVIEPARKSANGYPTYICPCCGNGSGESGDGLTVQEYSWGYNYHCFKCEKNFTAVDLIALKFGYDQKYKFDLAQVAEKAGELFNLKDNFSYFNGENKKVAAQIKAQATENIQTSTKNYSKFYQSAQNQLAGFIEKQGGTFRGLSLEDFQEVGAGIATAADLKSIGETTSAECLILPYSASRFFIRSISDNDTKRGNTGGKKIEIYNPYEVNFENPVFVVEGEIDCLSIRKASNLPAVALGGAGEYKNLIDDLKRRYERDRAFKAQIILLFDNNDTGAGQENAAKAKKELQEEGFQAVNFILSPNEKFDANEFLRKDSQGLKSRLNEIYDSAKEKFAHLDAKIYGRKIKDYFIHCFHHAVKEAAVFAERKTGFKNLDERQIFLPGLYVIGGLSAVGKTTFLWQLLEQLAASGETCIYCSYEMSELEMFAKSASREFYRIESENYKKQVSFQLTAADIRRGNIPDEKSEKFFGEAFRNYQETEMDLRVMELSNETINKLLKRLYHICAGLNKPPIICVDYLQIIPSEKENSRGAVDEIVRKLKNFQRATKTTFIVASSFNRTSYLSSVSFSSFKESGNIEFTADVLWGLQLYAVNQLKIGDHNSKTNQETMEKAKREIPRRIELKCLKNRQGADYSCYFKYLPHVDTFLECKESDFKDSDVD